MGDVFGEKCRKQEKTGYIDLCRLDKALLKLLIR